MSNAQERLWRSLVRVIDLNEEHMVIYIPSLGDVRDTVKIPRKSLPPEIDASLKLEQRLHVRVNLGAVRMEQLRFEDWEPR